ncbi:hypothetical protein JTE90_027548 [Oedothorax gibbosus]|uniref:Cysteine--tRNA ligase, cytoplasmic n=1 Tax=Oedothorax gibbosus TaxID=931172 RepID=A0AAV6VLA3_9ARAC|nr:hypothetical protein JTE90_027548 [Oedothorax gibbosus]
MCPNTRKYNSTQAFFENKIRLSWIFGICCDFALCLGYSAVFSFEKAVTMSKRCQPHWQCPESEKTKLKLYNSLTREKEIFVPQFGNKVLWYSCGPTVYDASHMGHARSYISFDILRRVLSEYFSYDVFYVMNITDIDDKIIKRARQKFLYEQYVAKCNDLSQAISDVRESVKSYKVLLEVTEDKDKRTMLENIIVKTETSINNAENKMASEGEDKHKIIQELLESSEDTLSEWQDKLGLANKYDNSIFFSLPAKWEEEFYKDMEALNVLPPDAVTRVTEYIPEIITYVEKIIENGLAYESNGSIYFDTMKFDEMPNHFYGKLVPEAFGDVKKLQEGEGELSLTSEKLREKKSPSDFAVWKASKPGEPSWESPWGKGRPGWHIECSVMASALLGESMDIHTGGYDLKFPHHDNELAQSEAYFNNDHWVRYFLHSGHLTISGCKMSKSLKNFVTIRSALEQNTARQLRLAFLLHSWKDTLDYSPQTLEKALQYEKLINEFFLNVKDSIRDIPRKGRGSFQKWEEEERKLHAVFQQAQTSVNESLCDNIDTRRALEDGIRDLVSSSNNYIKSKKSSHSLCNRQLLTSVMAYISKILRIFGASFGDLSQEFSSDSSNVQVTEDLVMPYLRTMADFRENIRQEAKEIKATQVLKLCDELRDDILPVLGVRLEDQEGLKAAIKLVDPAELAREKEIKQRMEAEKRLEKERKKQEQEALKEAREAAKRMPPSEMFKAMTDKYSKFDDKKMDEKILAYEDATAHKHRRLSKTALDQSIYLRDYMYSEPENSPDSLAESFQFPTPEKSASTALQLRKRIRCRTEAQRIARDAKKLKLRTPCNSDTCKMKCATKISLAERKKIMEDFKKMSDFEKKSWVFQRVDKESVKRKTTESLRRKVTFKYSFEILTGTYRVCKVFFLGTLGYHPKNDKIITTAMKATKSDPIMPFLSRRGCKTPPNKIKREPIVRDTSACDENVSHINSELTTKCLNFPSQSTVSVMHNSYPYQFSNEGQSFRITRSAGKTSAMGIPTHDLEGKVLTDSQLKKVMKLYSAQEKKYNDYLKSVATS